MTINNRSLYSTHPIVDLRLIQTSDESYAFVEDLFLSAFPENERRDTEAQRYNTDNNPFFHCSLIEQDKPVGFITLWDFESFCYIEHFAIHPSCRNNGLGQQALLLLMEKSNRPFVLEVELPQDEVSRRRIGFYERLGFSLWKECRYIQPPYHANGQALPMYLMATKELVPQQDFERIRQQIYEAVYLIPSCT